VPQRFAGAVGNPPPTEGPRAEFIKGLQERINKGIVPLYGRTGCEAIENDWLSTNASLKSVSQRSSRASTSYAAERRDASLAYG
jgi:hypothetical protein